MEHVTSKDGTNIAFEKKGSGPALIIVSGALSYSSLLKDKSLIDKLSGYFTVYIYDRRGRGESTDVPPYAVQREIEDIDAIITYAGGSAFLYGVSSGAALTLKAAAALGPQKVIKIAVYETPFGQKKQDFTRQRQRINELVRKGEPGEAAVYFLSEIGTPPKVIEEMKNSEDWNAIKKIDFTLVYDYLVLGDGNIPHITVKSITVPALVMDGENTLDFIHTTADQLEKLIPNAQRKTLKGQSHKVEADVMAPLLIAFFREHMTETGS